MNDSIDMNMLNEFLLKNNMNDSKDLAGSYEGYLRGNMFNDIYDQYKNYKPARLIPNNEKAELLLNINQTTFAAHDIRLYLDINPEDKNLINIYNDYIIKADNAIKEYENKYGPINMNSKTEDNTFSWEMYDFPWEVGDK